MSFLLIAISLGFFGSFHCIGMCGPIALALPVGSASPLKKAMLIISYNFGRILTYSFFGLLAGLIGKSISMAGYQQLISISIGSLMLLVVLVPAKYTGTSRLNAIIYSFFGKLKTSFSNLFKKKGFGPLFSIGLLNGFLPCGLVYVAMAGSITTGETLSGMLFMATFGAGTLPIMIAMPYLGSFIDVKTRTIFRRTVPVIITITAVILILRGLNLGIPYLSPKIGNDITEISCEHPQNLNSKNSIPCAVSQSEHQK